MNKKNLNDVLKQKELEEGKASDEERMTLDSTERVKVLSPGQLVFKRFINNKLAIVGSVILIFMFLFAFICPLFYPYSQTQIFYKYDKTLVDYAMATERTEYSLVLVDDAMELDSSVKNRLTASIRAMQEAGETEISLVSNQGESYLVKENNHMVYSLYAAPKEEVATLSKETKYADYNGILDKITYAGEAEAAEGFEQALATAIAGGKSGFTVAGMEYRIEAGRKQTYQIYAAGSAFQYTDKALGQEFEALVQENMEAGIFSYNGREYGITSDKDQVTVYKNGEQQLIGYLTDYVFDAYEDAALITDVFKSQAVAALVKGGSFEAEGVSYKVVEEDSEVYIYADQDNSLPVAVLSNMVIRNYDGTDTLEFAYKEKVHEVIENMQASGALEDTFTWNVAQVDSNGEYTYDENGNRVKEEVEVKIVLKNGSYVMSFPTVTYLIDIYATPSKDHWLGTDGDGMDVLARMMYGGRVSLVFCFVVIIIELILGVIMGGIAGYFGGFVDNIIMRAVDIFYCIPTMPILIILGALFDALKMPPYTRVMWMMAVLGFFGWAGVARMVRGQILSLREQEFMVATEAIGLRTSRRIFRHLIPNVMPQLIVTASSGLGSIIIMESTLSYLGLGVKHPLATWGTMINSVSTAEAMVRYTYIWIPVGLLICLTVIAFNFVGDGLRDAFDPKMKR